MSRVISYAKDHRLLVGTVLGGAVAVAIFVVVWFQPQKLFTDETVRDLPDTGTTSETLASGSFRSHDHKTTGEAKILRVPTGR